MERIQQFRVPLIIGAVGLVLLVVIYAAFVSPQGSKATSLDAQKTTLLASQGQLQSQIDKLKSEKANVQANCSTLTKDLNEIPTAPDISDFLQQMTALAQASGDPSTPNLSIGSPSKSTSGAVNSVQVSLSLGGTFGQMMTFIQGLDPSRTLNDATLAGNVLTSPSGRFTASDVGSVASTTSASGITLGTTIVSVQSPTQVTLGPPPGKSSVGTLTPAGATAPVSVTLTRVARTVTDGTTTAGSAVVTSSKQAQFTQQDLGRAVNGAGIPNGSTIVSVQSATQATMSQPASVTAVSVAITVGDLFQRLFTVSSVSIAGGPIITGTGILTADNTAAYSLALVGNIYFASVAAVNICTASTTTTAPTG